MGGGREVWFVSDATSTVAPLGGFGEIGKNLWRWNTIVSILVIDAGPTFPENDMPGIDLVYPSITYLTELVDGVLAILQTHGHEDHIGALPHLLKDLDVPVYATGMAPSRAEIKLKEAGPPADSESQHGQG